MSTRNLLIFLLAILGFMIYLEWQRDYVYPSRPSTVPEAVEPVEPAVDPQPPVAEDLPELPEIIEPRERDEEPDLSQPEIRPTRRIEVLTDVLKAEIDTVGGSIVDLRLIEYPVSLDHPEEPFVLLEQELPRLFVAQAGLLADDRPAPNHTTPYRAERDFFELSPGADRLEVPLHWNDGNGIEVTATWVFRRGDYVIDLETTVRNDSGEAWRGSRYMQLQRTLPERGNGPAFTNPERYSYLGGAVYHPDDKFRKLPLDDFVSKPYRDTFEGGWAAMIQHYFLAAWIPPAEQRHRYTTRQVDSDRLPSYVLAAASPQISVLHGEDYRFSARLYVGPKLQKRLEDVATGLSLTVDYRIFTILSKPLFWLLDWIHKVVGNWGWSIIILTLLIKIAFYKLTQAQFRSMGKMRKLQPRIQQLKERYGDDRQKFGQAMMEIYKKEKVNPLGGCLPILVQIPIFIALYWVLLESVELRQSSFLWVPDLSRPDPWFILPVINGIAMIATQWLMPTTGMDPMQRRLMQWLPVVFAFLFALFPAGLVLYWAANSGISLAQQWYILRQIEKAG